MFDNSLNFKLLDTIRNYSSGKPTLIFCTARKMTQMAAKQVT